MADIPVEKKKSNWWIWLLGLLAIVVLIWIVAEAVDEDEADVAEIEQVAPQEPTEPEESEALGVSISSILANADEYIGEPFPQSEVNVSEVPTDRGFWIEDEGQRLFAIIIDQPQEQPKDINPGQTLRIENGTLRDPSFLSEMTGNPLDQDTQSLAEEQEILLVVDERYINIIETGAPQAGTDTSESAQQ